MAGVAEWSVAIAVLWLINYRSEDNAQLLLAGTIP